MIGMKGFLISEADRAAALSILQNAGINALARDGAMLHIFPDVNFPTVKSALTASELNSLLNEQTSLAEYTENVHSKEAVTGFMLVLENAFCGLLIAFVVVLLFVTMFLSYHFFLPFHNVFHIYCFYYNINILFFFFCQIRFNGL